MMVAWQSIGEVTIYHLNTKRTGSGEKMTGGVKSGLVDNFP